MISARGTRPGSPGSAWQDPHYHPDRHRDFELVPRLVNARGGGNYQTMINEALRAYIQHQDKPLEETLRKVIREELRAQG